MQSARLFLLAVFTMFLVTSCSGICNDDFGGSSAGADNVPGAVPGNILKDVQFPFDSAALTPAAKANLKTSAEWLQANPRRTVIIEGHCDERGTVEYNLVLGEKRARAVYDYMRGLGVDAKRMSTISYGKEFPLDPASNEAAWAKNRRAHFAVK